MNDLVERLRDDLAEFEKHAESHAKWEYPYIIQNLRDAITALTAPTSEEVQHALEWLGEFNQEADDVREMRKLIERLAR